jgi:hypothetical protein
MLGENHKIIDKHVVAEVFMNCHTRETKANQAKMSNAKIALVDIVDKGPNTYNTNE